MAQERPARTKKKGRGRPSKYVLPPRIDATAEELVRTVLQAKPKGSTEADFPTEFRCAGCGRAVAYPEILYGDDRCSDCRSRPLRE